MHVPWENLRDFSTITGLVILNSRWWFDGCYMIVNFAKGNYIYQASFYLSFIILCKRFVHIMSKDLLCQSDGSDQSWNFFGKESLSKWTISMRFLIFNAHIHIWQISDSLLQRYINFKTYLFPGSTFCKWDGATSLTNLKIGILKSLDSVK